jgi:1-acyl-sn-glycerol-3-phosphate acyltransferase
MRHLLLNHLRTYQAYGVTLKASARIVVDAQRNRLTHELADAHIEAWAKQILNIAEANIEVHGQETIPRGESYVLMSNHASFLDIPSVIRAFPYSVRMVAKKEMGAVPVFGHALRQIGTIIVDRSDTKKSIAELNKGKAILNNNVSVWIAPEGTRSKDGKLGRFRKGGFHLAMQLGVRILPIWIQGTYDIYSPTAKSAKRGGQIQVRFGAPIATQGMVKDNLNELMESVRNAMLDMANHCGQKH